MRTFALHILDMQGVDVEWGPAPGKCSSRRESGDSGSSENSAATSSSIDSANDFPLFLSAPVVLFYLSLLSLVVSNCDWGDQPSLSFGDAFYFSLVPFKHSLHIHSHLLSDSSRYPRLVSVM